MTESFQHVEPTESQIKYGALLVSVIAVVISIAAIFQTRESNRIALDSVSKAERSALAAEDSYQFLTQLAYADAQIVLAQPEYDGHSYSELSLSVYNFGPGPLFDGQAYLINRDRNGDPHSNEDSLTGGGVFFFFFDGRMQPVRLVNAGAACNIWIDRAKINSGDHLVFRFRDGSTALGERRYLCLQLEIVDVGVEKDSKDRLVLLDGEIEKLKSPPLLGLTPQDGQAYQYSACTDSHHTKKK